MTESMPWLLQAKFQRFYQKKKCRFYYSKHNLVEQDTYIKLLDKNSLFERLCYCLKAMERKLASKNVNKKEFLWMILSPNLRYYPEWRLRVILSHEKMFFLNHVSNIFPTILESFKLDYPRIKTILYELKSSFIFIFMCKHPQNFLISKWISNVQLSSDVWFLRAFDK